MSDSAPHISHYRLVAKLGQGAMGEIYRAVDERLGRAVALKLLPRELEASPEMQGRLVREAQAVSALNHPGIVTLHDIGAWEGRVFLVMELVDGERFSAVARSGISADEALRMVVETAGALGAAHARGIFHRDIKSDNLMRTREGRVKVLDFGLAKATAHAEADAGQPPSTATSTSDDPLSDTFPLVPAGELQVSAIEATLSSPRSSPPGRVPLASEPVSAPRTIAELLGSNPSGSGSPLPSGEMTQVGQLVGTPAYMAPEQTLGGAADARSEVFSLGVVLYELLVGKRPFDRPTVPEMLRAIREDPIVPPSRAAPDRAIAPAVDQLVMQALERAPERRFPDMAAFAAAAQVAMAATVPFPRAKRPVPRLLVALIGLVVLGALGGGAALIRAHHPHDALPPAGARSTRRITFAPGCEEYPSFTPDGRTIVYDGIAEGDYELLALEIESGATRRLTHSPGWDYGAAVSPDGRFVGYVHLSDAARELRLLPIDGDGARPPRTLGALESRPTWSADGALLAADDAARIRRWDPAAPAAPPTFIAAFPPGSHVVGFDAFRDGDLVAIWGANEDAEEVNLGEIRGGRVTRVFEALRHEQLSLTVGRSQRDFYHSRGHGATHELVRRPRSGGPAEVVPGGIAPSSGFATSSDGKHLAYSTCIEAQEVVRVGADGHIEQLMPRGEWRDHSPIALDRHRILFTSDRTGSNETWLLESPSRTPKPLPGLGSATAAVSPDGARLAFQSRDGIYLVGIGGGERRPITDREGDTAPAFSSDGREVYFRGTRDRLGTRLYAVSVNGGEVRPIAPEGSSGVATSPASRDIVYLQETPGGQRLMVADPHGVGARPLREDLAPGAYSGPRLSRDGKHVAVLKKYAELLEIDVAGDAPPQVKWRSTTEGMETVDYSHDGDGFLATLGRWDGDLWLAEGDFR